MHQLFLSLVFCFKQRRNSACSKGNGLPLTPTVIVSFDHVNGCIVKDPVQGAKQRGILAKELAPLVRSLIARKDHQVRTFLVIPAVNDIKEHPGGLNVKHTPANFINNETGRFYQSVDR